MICCYGIWDICCSQEFAHPQARFLHEKRRQLGPHSERYLSGLLRRINRVSYDALHGAMFIGVVRDRLCSRTALGLKVSGCQV